MSTSPARGTLDRLGRGDQRHAQVIPHRQAPPGAAPGRKPPSQQLADKIAREYVNQGGSSCTSLRKALECDQEPPRQPRAVAALGMSGHETWWLWPRTIHCPWRYNAACETLRETWTRQKMKMISRGKSAINQEMAGGNRETQTCRRRSSWSKASTHVPHSSTLPWMPALGGVRPNAR